MPVIDIRAEVDKKDLLKVVEQFSAVDLEDFIRKVLLIKAKRKEGQQAKQEASLLAIIQQRFTAEEQTQFEALIKKRQANTITKKELTALQRWTDYSEQIAAERANALYELAQLRQTSVRDLMKTLNFQPQGYE